MTVNCNDAVRSQMCMSPQHEDVMTCAKLRPDSVIILSCKKCFTVNGLWVHVREPDPRCNLVQALIFHRCRQILIQTCYICCWFNYKYGPSGVISQSLCHGIGILDIKCQALPADCNKLLHLSVITRFIPSYLTLENVHGAKCRGFKQWMNG